MVTSHAWQWGRTLSLLRERVRFDSWSLPYWLAVGLGALAYYALARLGMQFFSRELGVSPVWPASGLAVAMIRLFGLRMWPAIFIGALGASIFGQSQIVAVISATGSTLEGVAGGLIINRLVSRHSDSFIMAQSTVNINAEHCSRSAALSSSARMPRSRIM